MSAQIRFAHYQINREHLLQTEWRLPLRRVDQLFAQGKGAWSMLNRTGTGAKEQEAVVALERVVKALARADDWTRRLAPSLRKLGPEAKDALGELVNLGCIPDPLLECVEAQASWAPSGGTRKDTLIYRLRLISLSELFERLATACDEYLRFRSKAQTATYDLDEKMPVWLRQHVVRMRAYIHDTNPKHTERGVRATRAITSTMHDTKAITGQFQDDLLARLLSETTRHELSVEALRKMRARARKRGPAELRRLRDILAHGSPKIDF